MALFKNLFNKSSKKNPRGFEFVKISSIDRISPDTVKVSFDAPKDGSFDFIPGQYVNVAIQINGKEERRSYSICSGETEPLSIGVKEVLNGTVSKWFNLDANVGTEILISKPEGNFTKPVDARNCVAIAAGSGITPIVSIAKQLEANGSLRLYYGNKREEDILFRETLDGLKNTSPVYFLSQEDKENFEKGRITKEALADEIKKDLSILKSDVFFLCGPEEMIKSSREALEMFGITSDKIKFELFTTPTEEMKPKAAASADNSNFSGASEVTIIIDGDEETFTVPNNKTILDGALAKGIDAPYSCRGGVCSSCKGKIVKGSANMRINYSLTDSEIEEGYILTCQAEPREEKITIDYDQV